MQVRAVQGDTVDLLCWRHLGVCAGVTEQTLALNPGLADLSANLPAGTLVTLPDLPEATTTATTVQLWD
eukprot:739-Eustigmatos_ZCMA.PRE.1